MTKTCKKCAKTKNTSEFGKHKAASDGLKSSCKNCVSAYNREWRQSNPEYHSEWRNGNPGYDAAWRTANRDKAVVATAQWRARGGVPVNDLTLDEWRVILTAAEGRCHYCRREAALEIEHMIPLSRGGSNTKGNIVAACGHCNKSKGRLTAEEFLSTDSMREVGTSGR